MSDSGAETDTSLARAPGEPDYSGPHAVGRYAKQLQQYLRGRARVRLIGEVTGLAIRAKAVYFELRDADGALPCSMWRNVFDDLELTEGALRDGAEVVVAGHLDYFPGSANSSPSFSFRITYLRLAGEGDLLAQLARLRKQLAAEGVFEPQKLLPIPGLPRTIGVVTGNESNARADLLAGFDRRHWRGRLIFAHVPVQGTAAPPRIAAALRALAEIEQVELVIVARGGGSLTDLWCFCDEALCRTVSLLRVPVIAGIGHQTDSTLIDDVAARSCSTPTHAAESAIGFDVEAEWLRLGRGAATLRRRSAGTIGARARDLGGVARVLAHHTRAERRRLHQKIREIRAAGRRATEARAERNGRAALVLTRRRSATLHATGRGRADLARSGAQLARRGGEATSARVAALERLGATLSAHDPERVLDRGYAIVEQPGDGDAKHVITTAAEARRAERFHVRFADDHVGVRIDEDE